MNPALRQHTPGPWHAAGLHVAASKTLHLGLPCHHPVANVIFSSGDELNDIERVASAQCFVESPGSITAEANARLIAAAPDLLAALEDITDRYARAMKDSGVSHYPEAMVEIRSARAAIARATGGAA